MGWATPLIGALGFIALMVGVLYPIILCSIIGKLRLAPPRVRGLAPGEEPRYLELITDPARRRCEELGFRRAGYLATQPAVETEPEVVQLVMRNDETRTLAYFHVRHPFTEARPSTVSFESFLPDGTVFATLPGFTLRIGARLPNHRPSAAEDDQGIYRDHLAALVRSGLATIELPASFEGLVALNINDAAWIWRTNLDRRVVVAAPAGGFRFARWATLASIPRLVSSKLVNAIVEARRRRSDRTKGPVVDAHVPEIRDFLEERTRRRKEALKAVTGKPTGSPGKTIACWIALVSSFTVAWNLIDHQKHSRSTPSRATVLFAALDRLDADVVSGRTAEAVDWTATLGPTACGAVVTRYSDPQTAPDTRQALHTILVRWNGGDLGDHAKAWVPWCNGVLGLK